MTNKITQSEIVERAKKFSDRPNLTPKQIFAKQKDFIAGAMWALEQNK